MNKIVVTSEQAECNEGLIALLKALFPECDICVMYPQTEGFESDGNPSSLDWYITDEVGRRLWQKFK